MAAGHLDNVVAVSSFHHRSELLVLLGTAECYRQGAVRIPERHNPLGWRAIIAPGNI
jgi:hypothetical protein